MIVIDGEEVLHIPGKPTYLKAVSETYQEYIDLFFKCPFLDALILSKLQNRPQVNYLNAEKDAKYGQYRTI